MTPNGIGLMAPHWKGSISIGDQGNLTTQEVMRIAATFSIYQESGMTPNANSLEVGLQRLPPFFAKSNSRHPVPNLNQAAVSLIQS